MAVDDQALRRICLLLERGYGKKERNPSGMLLDELVQTILSQATNDASSGRAFASLKAAFPTWDLVRDSPLEEVASAISSGGLSRQKAVAIKRILEEVTSADGQVDLNFLREMEPGQAYEALRRFGGVGPKTAACVLLFGLGRPFFPVDTHILRIFRRLGLAQGSWGAEKLQEAIQRTVPAEIVLSLHLNLIAHGRQVCRARAPLCGQCVLRESCRWPGRTDLHDGRGLGEIIRPGGVPDMKTGQKSGESDPLEELKYRAASELGLLDKVREKGWGGLSARESGQVGGRMTRIMVEKARKS